jgi:drug/metabolite transporter (DMT)-like permease
VRLSRLLVIGAAVLFSTGGAAIKGTGYEGIPGGLEVAGLRSGIGAVVIALVIPASRRGWTWRTWAVGSAYAATVILFVLANKQTTSANAIFLQSAAPLYVLVAGIVVLRERVRSPDVLLMLVLVAGLSLFLVDPGEAVATAPEPAIGNALALASGVTWAATLLGLRGLGRGAGGVGGAAGATVAGNLIAAAICIPTAIPTTGDGTDWLLVAYLGIVQIGLAYVLLTTAVQNVPAFEVSLLLLVEPALNPVWSWAVHGERPGGAAIAGGLLILGATAAKVALDWRRGTPTALEPRAPAAPP